jgi:hypothetical protein
MQKVVGSSPIIRSKEPAQAGSRPGQLAVKGRDGREMSLRLVLLVLAMALLAALIGDSTPWPH